MNQFLGHDHTFVIGDVPFYLVHRLKAPFFIKCYKLDGRFGGVQGQGLDALCPAMVFDRLVQPLAQAAAPQVRVHGELAEVVDALLAVERHGVIHAWPVNGNGADYSVVIYCQKGGPIDKAVLGYHVALVGGKKEQALGGHAGKGLVQQRRDLRNGVGRLVWADEDVLFH
jgi:hypothetical protein